MRHWGIFVGLLALLLGCNTVLDIPPEEHRPPSEEGGAGNEPECSTSADCASDGADADVKICREGRCVRLLMQPECPLALPDTDKAWRSALAEGGPEPLILGAFTSIPGTQLGTYSLNYDLVLTEVRRAVGGVPTASGEPRPVIVLACENLYESTADFDRAIDHLVKEVQVPGILATLRLEDLTYAFDRARDERVLFWNLRDADPSLGPYFDSGLLWSILPGLDVVGTTYGPLLERTLENLVKRKKLAAGAPARVALVRVDDLQGYTGLGLSVRDELVWNGKHAAENAPDYFLDLAVPTSLNKSSSPAVYSAAIEALRTFKPDVVVATGTDEFVTVIMPALEGGDSDHTETIQPFYLLSPWHAFSSLGDVVREFNELNTRILGVNFAAAADPTVYKSYQARFDAAYIAQAGQSVGYENYYDAPYYMIYSAAAAGSAWPLRGTDLDFGMRRLLSGPSTFSVGPDDLPSALPELTQSSGITLNGAMGPPDFDPETGTRKSAGTVWCIEFNGVFHMDQLRLNAANELEGKAECLHFE